MMATITPVTTRLSALDQIMPRVYTRLILTFPISKEEVHPASQYLQKGLERTVAKIPFLMDDVMKVQERPGWVALGPRLAGEKTMFKVKDLINGESGWTRHYEDLQAEGMPMSELDGDILAPVGRMMPEGASPVMAAQMNIIEGGCLLCVCKHHSVMDGIGLAAVLRCWAHYCRDLQNLFEPTSELPGWSGQSLDRSQLLNGGLETHIKNFPGYEITPLAQQSIATDGKQPVVPSLPPMTAAIFELDMNAIVSLKHEILEHLDGLGPEKVWVSTNDVLCTVLWRAITRARALSDAGQQSEDESTAQVGLGMAVNGRARFNPPLPATYVGNFNVYSMVTCELPLSKFPSLSSLGKTALAIRGSINAIDDTYIRSLIHLVDSLPDATAVQPAFKSFLGKDLAITSWADLGLYDLDWGPAIGGGKIDFVRIPKAGFDGICIVLPRMENGAVEVIVGLKQQDMDVLKDDEAFLQYASLKCQ